MSTANLTLPPQRNHTEKLYEAARAPIGQRPAVDAHLRHPIPSHLHRLHVAAVALLPPADQLHLGYLATHLHDTLLLRVPIHERHHLRLSNIIQRPPAVRTRLVGQHVGHPKAAAVARHRRRLVVQRVQRAQPAAVHLVADHAQTAPRRFGAARRARALQRPPLTQERARHEHDSLLMVGDGERTHARTPGVHTVSHSRVLQQATLRRTGAPRRTDHPAAGGYPAAARRADERRPRDHHFRDTRGNEGDEAMFGSGTECGMHRAVGSNVCRGALGVPTQCPDAACTEHRRCVDCSINSLSVVLPTAHYGRHWPLVLAAAVHVAAAASTSVDQSAHRLRGGSAGRCGRAIYRVAIGTCVAAINSHEPERAAACHTSLQPAAHAGVCHLYGIRGRAHISLLVRVFGETLSGHLVEGGGQACGRRSAGPGAHFPAHHPLLPRLRRAQVCGTRTGRPPAGAGGADGMATGTQCPGGELDAVASGADGQLYVRARRTASAVRECGRRGLERRSESDGRITTESKGHTRLRVSMEEEASCGCGHIYRVRTWRWR
eukprot:ctg_129.g106